MITYNDLLNINQFQFLDDLSSMSPKLKLVFGNSWNPSEVLDLFDRLESCKEETSGVFWTKVSLNAELPHAVYACVFCSQVDTLRIDKPLKTHAEMG